VSMPTGESSCAECAGTVAVPQILSMELTGTLVGVTQQWQEGMVAERSTSPPGGETSEGKNPKADPV
jgi:hypothetical protein